MLFKRFLGVAVQIILLTCVIQSAVEAALSPDREKVDIRKDFCKESCKGQLHYHRCYLTCNDAQPVPAASKNVGVCSRTVTEYLIPPSEQTQEILYLPGKDVLLITQMSNSVLVKSTTAPGDANGGITASKSYQIGTPTSGLHGLTASGAYPGKVWVSLQHDNQLILLDPKLSDVNAAPETIKILKIPDPGNGPHHILELGNDIWATLKVSYHVLRMNHKNPNDFHLYESLPAPVFIAQHPISNEIFVAEYKSDTILRINTKENTMSRISVPDEFGQSPVGLISDGNFTWVALLSMKSIGTGGFGKIASDGTTTWYNLKTPFGKKAQLIHIAVDPDEKTESRPGIWFLGTSINRPESFDMIIRTHFDENFENFLGEEITFLPSQKIKAHRMAASRSGLYVTEETSSRVAFYKRTKGPSCDFGFQ